VHLSGWELAACLAIVVVGSFVQGSIGFGLNLVVTPVIALIDPSAVPGAVVLLALPLTVTMAVREHQHVDWHGVTWILLGWLPGVCVGVAVVTLVATDTLTAVVGAVILVAVGLNLVHTHVRVTRTTAAAAGATAGAMGAAAAISGPPLALLYQHHHGEAIRATLAMCFIIGALMTTTALAVAGEIRAEQLLLTLTLLPALLVGLVISTWAGRWLHGRSLRPAVLSFAAVAGLAALIRGLS